MGKNTLVGWCHPVDAFPMAPKETWAIYDMLNPDVIVIQSNASADDFERLYEQYKPKKWRIRHKVGPRNQGILDGKAEENPLDYDEKGYWRSLRQVLQWCMSKGIDMKDVTVIADNEPDIEIPAEGYEDDVTVRGVAVESYIYYFLKLAAQLEEADFGCLLAVAPLSQGNQERFMWWVKKLQPCYQRASGVSEHCYWGSDDINDPVWGGRWALWVQLISIDEFNDNETFFGLSEYDRGKKYGEYIYHIVNVAPLVETIAIFTAPCLARPKPWWPVTPEMVRGILVAMNAPPIPVPVDPPPADPPVDGEPTNEPPTSEPTEETRMGHDEALAAALDDMFQGNAGQAGLHLGQAISDYWRANKRKLGSACGPEHPVKNGDDVIAVYQAFALAVVIATPGDPWTVEIAEV